MRKVILFILLICGLGVTPRARAQATAPHDVAIAGSQNYNVKERFGAKGDGVADDTAAIHAAYAALPAAGGAIFLPCGIYNTTGIVLGSRLKAAVLQGEDKCSQIHLTSAGGSAITLNWGVGSSLGAGGIKDVTLTGPGASTSSSGINVKTAVGFVLRDVEATGFGTGITSNFASSSNWSWVADHVFIHDNGVNVSILGGSESVKVVNSIISNYTPNHPGCFVSSVELVAIGDSFDSCQVVVSGIKQSFIGDHFENPNLDTIDYMVAKLAVNWNITLTDDTIAQDRTSSPPEEFLSVNVSGGGGALITFLGGFVSSNASVKLPQLVNVVNGHPTIVEVGTDMLYLSTLVTGTASVHTLP